MSPSRNPEPELLVIMPAFNEEACIRKVVLEWNEELNRWTQNFLLLVINDGSKDGTQAVLERLQKEVGARLQVIHRENRGHGQTCLQGYRLAVEREIPYVLQLDSDGQCAPRFFKEFWRQRNDCDVIYGRRVTREDGWRRVLASLVLKMVLRVCTGIVCTDANVPYRLMRTGMLVSVLPRIPADFFLVNVAMAVLLKQERGVRHGCVAIRFRKRYAGESHLRLGQFGSRARELIRQLRALKPCAPDPDASSR